MPMRRRSNSRAWIVFLFVSSLLLSSFPGLISKATVTLDSIEIFKTHEWTSEPTVYFNCKGENKTVLPDVKKKDILYTFKGEESWQPLTVFSNKKCKRCGIYEKDSIKSDDVFAEWELCPSDFTAPDGKYQHSKDKEFNATFSCGDCVPLGSDSQNASSSHSGGKVMHWAAVVVISVVVTTVFIIGLVIGYKYWQKRKRQHEQARFLRLFEDGDDIEDELGIGPLSSVI